MLKIIHEHFNIEVIKYNKKYSSMSGLVSINPLQPNFNDLLK